MNRTQLLSCAAAAAAVLAAAGADAQSRDRIRIVGSSTVFPFATAVAENFARGTQFQAPVIESTGSGGGFRLFCQGVGTQTPDITNASRRMTANELEACRTAGVQDVTEVVIGYDGIVIANSREAADTDYTVGQLWRALAARVPVDGELVENPYERWSQIDPSLPDKEIQVFGPPPTSGTRDAFTELVMEEGCAEFEAVRQLPEDQRDEACTSYRTDGAFVEAGENDNLIVQRLQSEPDAYGIFGYSFLDQNRNALRGSSVGGAQPTFENISSGEYPVSRSLFFYVKNAHVGVVPGIREYVAEFTSERAIGESGYLSDRGLIPLPAELQDRVRTEAANLDPVTAQELQGPVFEQAAAGGSGGGQGAQQQGGQSR
jgi:phosphate transport system substrate-binding protein